MRKELQLFLFKHERPHLEGSRFPEAKLMDRRNELAGQYGFSPEKKVGSILFPKQISNY